MEGRSTELPAEIDSDIISETNGGEGYVKDLARNGNQQPERFTSIDGVSYRPAGGYAGGSIRELYRSAGKEKAFTRTEEYKRAASEIRGTIILGSKQIHYSSVSLQC